MTASSLGRAIRLSVSALALVAALVAAPLGAQELSIAAFYGHWKGSGISESETSLYFRLTARDLDVVIRPEGAGIRSGTHSRFARDRPVC